MHIIAFILALVALIIFVADYMRGKAYLALGLAFLTAAWIAQLILETGSRLTIH